MKTKAFLKKPHFFEKIAWKNNLLVCGIDEVGRGCLAGPVVVSAVMLPPKASYPLLKDSKLLKKDELLEAYVWITKKCHYSIASMSWKEVDRLNIYQATLRAMKKSFIALIESHTVQLENIKYLLIDAMPVKLEPEFSHKELEVHSFPYGESISPSIAAASIVAKVTRDRIMGTLGGLFPTFSLEKHKGYGTKTHWNCLESHGATIIHRNSFLRSLGSRVDNSSQISILENYE